MPGQIAEYEEAKRTESVSSDKVSNVCRHSDEAILPIHLRNSRL